MSQLVALTYENDERYVIKVNDPSVVKVEEDFLNTYKTNSRFPTVTYVDSEPRFMIYGKPSL